MQKPYLDLIKESDPVNAEIIQKLLDEIKDLKEQLASIQENCPHDIDDGICLNCQKDFREELAAQAYERYKDRVKYGDD